MLQTSSGQVSEVPVRDYIIGAVCAEMPASFETEALKAQAVACHTYAVRRQMKENSSPDTELKGADFSDDSSKYQAYFTADQIKSFYGENYEEYYSKVCSADTCVRQSAGCNGISFNVIRLHGIGGKCLGL